MSSVEPSRPRPAWRRVLGVAARSVWVRLVVTVGLLVLVASQIDWNLMGQRVADGQPGWGAVAVVLVVSALVVGAVRWDVLLRVAGLRLTASSVGRVYAISTFSSTFLPTSVGGDVARALLVARRGRLLALAGLTVVLDRAAAFAGLIVVAIVAWLVDPGAIPSEQAHLLLAITAVCVVATVVLAVLLVRPPAWASRRIPARAALALAELRTVTLACLRRPPVVLIVLSTSVVLQGLVVLSMCSLARTFGIGLTFPVAAVAVALVSLAMLVPISIAGFGIREGSYIALLGASGVSATDATLLSLATVATLFIASLPGALMLARRGTAPALGVS